MTGERLLRIARKIETNIIMNEKLQCVLELQCSAVQCSAGSVGGSAAEQRRKQRYPGARRTQRVQCSAVQCNVVQCSAVKQSPLWPKQQGLFENKTSFGESDVYIGVHYSAVLCSTVHYM
jgi:hypothetical protein